MNGDNWNNKINWLTNTNCCSWFGITCNNESRVVEIFLSSNNVSNNIPDLNNTLEFLNEIDMYGNSVTGDLNQLLSLKSLTIINLGNNLINDELPDKLFQSEIMSYINFQGNMLHGTIPEINCPKLKNLFLTDNKLSGNFPMILSSELYNIFVSHNNLINIPDTFNNTPKLQQLILNNNNIFDTLPKSLLQTNLRLLDISNNKFFGQIPKEFSKINTLEDFMQITIIYLVV